MKKVLFIEYPKCTTCQKAKKWLQDHQIAFDDRYITEQHPTADELKKWQKIAGLPLKSFFNTSGLLYKSMDLKNKLPSMADDEKLELLGSNGMLVKRPLVISDDFILIGFKIPEWEKNLPKAAAKRLHSNPQSKSSASKIKAAPFTERLFCFNCYRHQITAALFPISSSGLP